MAFPLAAAGMGGGLLGLLGGLLGGRGSGGMQGRTEQFQRFTPEQQAAFSQLLSQGMQGVDFAPIEEQARRQFQEQTIPSLAERFTSLGGGAQRSSAFQSSLGRAGSDLESRLAALRSQFGMQKLGLGLTPQFETAYFPRQPGFLEQSLGGGLQGIMQLLPLLLAGGR